MWWGRGCIGAMIPAKWPPSLQICRMTSRPHETVSRPPWCPWGWETFSRGLKVILQIWRLGGHFAGIMALLHPLPLVKGGRGFKKETGIFHFNNTLKSFVWSRMKKIFMVISLKIHYFHLCFLYKSDLPISERYSVQQCFLPAMFPPTNCFTRVYQIF